MIQDGLINVHTVRKGMYFIYVRMIISSGRFD